MIQRIQAALIECKLQHYLLTVTSQECAELFFTKKKLTMHRKTNTCSYHITIYHDFEKEGIKMRGSSSIRLNKGMTDSELQERLKSAYYAASFVNNPFYELPEGLEKPCIDVKSTLNSGSVEETALLMAEALFAEDIKTDVFINSAELFIIKKNVQIYASNKTDVSYTKWQAKGEFVTQCPAPQDVETYQDFIYNNLDTAALREKVKAALAMSLDRSEAKLPPTAGEYRVILSGAYLKELLEYYIARANASMIYQKYSNFAPGTKVQGEEVIGDQLNITLKPTNPYSLEGIKMEDLPLIKDGILQTIHGDSKFCYYLNTVPTGSYADFYVAPGDTSLQEMKKSKSLHVVSLSSIEIDPYTGHFGGEIRLAYYFDGETTTLVTGGSISGSIFEVQKNLSLSSDMQIEQGYEGPLAICLEKVKVAGA